MSVQGLIVSLGEYDDGLQPNLTNYKQNLSANKWG